MKTCNYCTKRKSKLYDSLCEECHIEKLSKEKNVATELLSEYFNVYEGVWDCICDSAIGKYQYQSTSAKEIEIRVRSFLKGLK
ncbi:MAG: hypothetical protein KKB59_19825 [Spirochaetes bacterium]|nr:hypothetical protein [Spirochaetota bacterium]